MNDIDLKHKLKSEATIAPDNPLFTQRLLNRLPGKRNSNMKWCIVTSFAMLIGCMIGWIFVSISLYDGDFLIMMNCGNIHQIIVVYITLLAMTIISIKDILDKTLMKK